MPHSIEIPMADRFALDAGWTVDPKFLQSISEKTQETEPVGEEGVEAVILALFGIHWNPKALLREPDDAE